VTAHAATPLAATALPDTHTFARRAGAPGAPRARATAMPKAPVSVLSDAQGEIDGILNRPTGGRRISEIKNELGETMNRYVAVYRDAEGLATAHEIVRRLKDEAPNAAIDDKGTVFNQDVLAAIELGDMLDVAEAIVVAAQERRESRGAQFRTDFPERNDADWLHHITVSLNGDGPELGTAPVTITKWEPQERTY
ncbi:MAG: succinate dehydrogenase/fumarate reductase flavoprotein subunit, partial [Conexibacter sp.]